MIDDKELGRKIAAYRQRRGLSQREFAVLVGRSEAWLSQVERGVRPVKTIEVLNRIAKELDVPVDVLAPTAPGVTAHEPPADAVPLRLLLSSNYALRARFDDSQPTAIDELETDVERVWDLAHEARYVELVELLKVLLPKLERAVQQANSDQARICAQLAKAYHGCAAALSKLGQFDAAWVSVDRAITNADRAGDALLMAEGAFRLCLVFQGARQFQQATNTAQTASDALERLVEGGQPEALSVYGALQLQLAVAAARAEEPGAAERHLARAGEIAARLGTDRNDYDTEFGPTNVALHEVAVAVELGDAGRAIRRAAAIDSSGLSPERQGRLLVDVARAWTQRRNVDEAVSALEQAEMVTPQQVRNHRLVEIMLRDLLRMEREPTPALAALVGRVGLSP